MSLHRKKRNASTVPAATNDSPRRRRGAIIVVIMICLLLISMISASLMKLATAQRRQSRRDELHMQASWLAESGLDRAAARLLTDAEYAGETWEPAAEHLDSKPAVVRIDVEPVTGADNRYRLRAVADYPRDSRRRARVSHEILLDRLPQ